MQGGGLEVEEPTELQPLLESTATPPHLTYLLDKPLRLGPVSPKNKLALFLSQDPRRIRQKVFPQPCHLRSTVSEYL